MNNIPSLKELRPLFATKDEAKKARQLMFDEARRERDEALGVPPLAEMLPHFATKAEAKKARARMLNKAAVFQAKMDAVVAEQKEVSDALRDSFQGRDCLDAEAPDFLRLSFTMVSGTATRRRLKRDAKKAKKAERLVRS